ncbi:MAG: hypothetical protein JWN68_1376 [Nocardioides sp.]|uniref:hypothetical protein n=1 Tax=Nocardioides sp. TaxID=35761 RepID=UPI002636E96C|nr:hypothetical protein [Nocardioides sp.]MCW2833423.1 hypothetical protein [Nocardioides sp.]
MQHLRARLPLVTTIAVVLVGSVFLLSQARQRFFGDDWMSLLERSISQRRGVDALMLPHNEHWSTVPILIYRAVFSVVGLEHYLVFAILPILAHAAACILLFLLLRRSGVQPWIAMGVTTVMVFLCAGAENMLWSFQVGMVGSGVLGLVRTNVRLRDAGVTSEPVPRFVGNTTEVHLGVTAADVELLVDLAPGSPFTVCER